MRKLWLLLPLLALFGFKAFAAENPVLKIEGGQIQGVTTDNPGVYVYKGIPYAAPPIGDLRWKEPQPVVAWEGIRQCDRFGHPGYQAVHYPGFYLQRGLPLSECLYEGAWRRKQEVACGAVDSWRRLS